MPKRSLMRLCLPFLLLCLSLDALGLNFLCIRRVLQKHLFQPVELPPGTRADVRLKNIQDSNNRISKIITSVEMPDGKVYRLGKKIGEGKFGSVYCWDPACTMVIKIPLDAEGAKRLTIEQEGNRIMRAEKIEIAKVHHYMSGQFTIRDFVDGIPAQTIIQHRGGLNQQMSKQLGIFVSKLYKAKIAWDSDSANIFWDERTKKWIVTDTDLVVRPNKQDEEHYFDPEQGFKFAYFGGNRAGYKIFLEEILKTGVLPPKRERYYRLQLNTIATDSSFPSVEDTLFY